MSVILSSVETPSRNVGDPVENPDVGFIIDHPTEDDARCYVAEHGMIIWAGSFPDFVDLVRGAARAVTPADGHGYSGAFTATEFNERAFDHDKAARNGLAAGPNVSYVRTFQACALALRMAAPLLPKVPV